MTLDDVRQWYDLSGKTAVVTGGTGALGSEMAVALVGCGANVAILARKPDLSDAFKAALDAGPGTYRMIPADVLKRDVLETAVAEIVAQYGRIDILINGAGGNHPQATSTADNPFFDLPEEALSFVFDLNLLGTICRVKLSARSWRSKGRGSF